MRARLRIGVLVGGPAGQRAASLRAGDAVAAALTAAGHDVATVFVDRDIDPSIRTARVDAAFLALRGRYGADGCVQGVLETLGIPYTGPGVLTAALTMNRTRTREVLRLHNLATPAAYVTDENGLADVSTVHGAFGFPAVVRPGSGGPSAGALALDPRGLELAIENALRLDDEVIVERATLGRIVTVGLLRGRPLGAIDGGPAAAKMTEMTGTQAPRAAVRRSQTSSIAGAPPISQARFHTVVRLAAQASEALGIDGAALIDVAVDEKAGDVIVDVDAAPSLVPDAPLARIAARAGVSFGALVEDILASARLRAHGWRRERRLGQATFVGPERRAGGGLHSAH